MIKQLNEIKKDYELRNKDQKDAIKNMINKLGTEKTVEN